ncbi:MAG: phosphotransferase [Caldilineaceae bacterium]
MMGRERQQEAARNRVLRRVDWRFLLPDPWPKNTLCFADGLLAAGVAAVSEKTTMAKVANAATSLEPEAFDLAVARNPNQTVLTQAWHALRPGGVCYSEWYRPLVGGLPGVTSRLAQAGFGAIAGYWPWPWPDRAPTLFWLPLMAPGALHYYQVSRPLPQSPWRRALYHGQWALWRLAQQAGWLAPLCVVAQKLEGDRLNDLPESLSRQFHSEGTMTVSAKLSPQGHWLLLTGGRRAINKVVGLHFADAATTPRLAVKWPRVPESAPALAQEARILCALQERYPTLTGAPRVIFQQGQQERFMVGESVVSGLPVGMQLNRDNYCHFALQAADWLAQLAQNSPVQPQSVWWERLIAKRLTRFRQCFGGVVAQAQLQQSQALLSTLSDLPLVCEQRDFSPWNVLVDQQGQFGVLDWESAELQGLPALDLIYFLTYLAFWVEGLPVHGNMPIAQLRRAYRATLDPTTMTGNVTAVSLSRYTQQIDLDPAAIAPLRRLTWLIHADSEYQHFCADMGAQPPAALLRQSLFVNLWEEDGYAGEACHKAGQERLLC